MLMFMPTGQRWTPNAAESRMLRVLEALIGPERGAQARLAEQTGISAPQLSKYLSGQKSMTIAELNAICEALGKQAWEVMKIADGR